MTIIPGWLISLLTFPGIMVHELAHVAFCRLFGVKVLKVCLFRLGNPPGYVVHDAPRSTFVHILISVGPFLLNTVLGGLVAIPGTVPVTNGRLPSPAGWALIWLGLSIAMHAFPSTGDAKSLWSALWSRGASWLGRIVGVPIVLVIYLGAIGSVFWLDVIYGLAVVSFTPRLLVMMMSR